MLNILQVNALLSAPRASRPIAKVAERVQLTRTFVETGDERCPLAGMWSAVLSSDATTSDEPESRWPALILLRAWRAFPLLFPATAC